MTTASTFSQFRAGGEHKGRTASLKAVAYCTGGRTIDERNNRSFDYATQGKGERILKSGIFLPREFPASFDRQRFMTEAALQQAVWTSLALHEEKQARRYARGGNKPIISRHDVLLLDKRIFQDAQGRMRPDGIKHAFQVVTDFLRENYTRKGLVASFAIHDQDELNGTGNGNFHVHIVSSYRTLTADGWGERKRPFGKSEWAVWAKEKQNSLFKIQTRKLEALGVIPKIERTSTKRETLTAWKIAQGFMTKQDFRLPKKFSDMNFRSAPVPKSKAISAERQPTFPAFIPASPACSKYAALSAAVRESDENRIQLNPENAGAGDSGGAGGGGGVDGSGDFVFAMLSAALGAAEEMLRRAKQTGIGIAIAQAAVDVARLNLRTHGSSGKGKAKSGVMKPRFSRHHHSRHQTL
jgi:hypothetical protein